VKVLLMLLLTLPIVWFVAGTLSPAPEEHAPRPPVILRDPNPSEPPRPSDNEPGEVEDHQRRDADQPRGDRPGVPVVAPPPTWVGHDGPAGNVSGGGERDDDDGAEGGDD
jgi:hypothetical protein